MFINPRLDLFLLVSLFCTPQLSARQNHSAAHPGDRIYLDVMVNPKSGPPVSGLLQQDFTILDNNVPQTITSFRAVDGRQDPAEVVIVIDAVNIGEREVAIEREEIKKFLKAEGGRLASPTRVALLTDKGLQLQRELSQDGSAISRALDHDKIPLLSIGRDADHGGAADRFQTSFQAFAQLIADERDRHGRKLILWVSPGWPPLLGLEKTRDTGLQEQVFGNIVEISTQLREGQITVYSIDPSGTTDMDPGLTDPPTDHLRHSDRKVYIEETSKPKDVGTRNLTLPIIAAQSGGLVLNPGNDLAAELQRCVADARTYYEISFDPVISDRPNEYHHLEIRVAKPGLTARTTRGYYSQPWPVNKFAAASERLGADANNQTDRARGVSYLDEPLAQLVERIPELKALQPVPGQQELAVILQKMGRRVDDFIRDVGDLIANENVTQEKLNANGTTKAKERLQDNYLILHHGYEWGANAEYRMDDKGNRLGAIGLEKGYLVTSGHALSCISFSTVTQAQSEFRYLGEEKIDSRETYVLGFAQQPGVATFTTTMTGTGGPDVDMLTQGILWVDKNSFQIIRMRSDLLTPNNEIRLDQLTTQVSFRPVKLQDVPNALWLPSDVDVYIEIAAQKFRNVHHYTNYRRYRVSVKIGASE
jgi:VWFA-related protein